MNKKKWWIITLLILIIAYLMGPHPATPVYDKTLPRVPGAAELDNYIKQHESLHKLRPDNEARIVWANDSLKNITEYAILYLHGFSASQGEGDPIHKRIAKKYGCKPHSRQLLGISKGGLCHCIEAWKKGDRYGHLNRIITRTDARGRLS